MAESSRGDHRKGADDVTYSQGYNKSAGMKRASLEKGDGGHPSKFPKSALSTHLPSKSDSSKSKGITKPIKISLSSAPKPKEPIVPKKKATVASVFGDDSDSEEEMPPEAKMRMKNVGRETPTAAGPNSYGKGRLGFCDRQRIIQREIQREIDDENDKGGPKQKQKQNCA